MESIIHIVDCSSVEEQQALKEAAARRIEEESAGEPQNHLLISTYRDILDDLHERNPARRGT